MLVAATQLLLGGGGPRRPQILLHPVKRVQAEVCETMRYEADVKSRELI